MILVAVLFILFGVLIKYGKMYFLIAGYNTMPQEEKDKYDADGIATVMKNGLFGMALIIIIGHFVSKWMADEQLEFLAMMIAILIGLPYILIKSNSDTYKIKKKKN